MLKRVNPEKAQELLEANKKAAMKSYEYYKTLSNN